MNHPLMRNRLLRALPPDDLKSLWPNFERLAVSKSEILISVGQNLEFTYFPECGLSSNLLVTDEGRRVEVGCFGHEAMINIHTVLGSDRSPQEILVQVGGPWLRIRVDTLHDAMRRSPVLNDLLLRYAYFAMMTVGQTAMSNAAFAIEQRLARWILMAHDRLEGDDVPLTHDFLSIMLAAQRTSVTDAMHTLEGYGAIRAKRARITVRDRAMLCDLAGKSYGPAEAEYERLIGPFRDKPGSYSNKN